ncbi:MAG: membrane protein insertion efficiency factor YidD [Nitrospinales bacterium]
MAIKKVFIIIIKIYQRLFSPFLAPCCRFHPSCSEYAVQALGQRRLIKALGLIIARLCKCHPYHTGGYDPVK